jgi:hypothetical protein
MQQQQQRNSSSFKIRGLQDRKEVASVTLIDVSVVILQGVFSPNLLIFTAVQTRREETFEFFFP